MNAEPHLPPILLERQKIHVFEPFAAFLDATEAEKRFQISLLDVVRFAGHACPSMIGAFLITKRAVEELFPETRVCVRGDVKVDLPNPATLGATGPMANVISYITGAWSDTGFGGLREQFKRRGLLEFEVDEVPLGGFRFTRLSSGKSVIIYYDANRAPVEINPHDSFQLQWRKKIRGCIENPQSVVWTEAGKSATLSTWSSGTRF